MVHHREEIPCKLHKAETNFPQAKQGCLFQSSAKVPKKNQ